MSYPRGHFAEKAMSRRDAVLVEDMHPAAVRRAGRRQSSRLGDEIGPHLGDRGAAAGARRAARRDELALSSLSKRPDPHYDGFDRDLIGAIASRVALAIDNAMLFEEERDTALAFQKHLLPGERPPRLDGLEIAWRYEPAKPLESHGQGIQTQVGGDWYDVIPLSAGRVGLVIGDVEGRGARAAAVMGQLRAALRAFAQDDKPPADILRKLDEWVPHDDPARADALRLEQRRLDPPPLVSCTYFVYDAWSRMLSFANAGHDPPLLIVDGEVGELEFEQQGRHARGARAGHGRRDPLSTRRRAS